MADCLNLSVGVGKGGGGGGREDSVGEYLLSSNFTSLALSLVEWTVTKHLTMTNRITAYVRHHFGGMAAMLFPDTSDVPLI